MLASNKLNVYRTKMGLETRVNNLASMLCSHIRLKGLGEERVLEELLGLVVVLDVEGDVLLQLLIRLIRVGLDVRAQLPLS